MQGRMGAQLMAIVAEGEHGRLYLSPDEIHCRAALVERPEECPTQELADDPRNLWCPAYGLDTFDKLFTNRQLVALTTFSTLVAEAQAKVVTDGGSQEYGQAVGVYLAFAINKMADLCNSLNRWEPIAQCPRQLFARQAIPMIWDFAESNIFSSSSGSWNVHINNFFKCINADSFNCKRDKLGNATQFDAQSDCGLRNILVSTDPPYYDNIGYADLSDFFYVWMRQSLKRIYPDLFRTMLVPKSEELVATPYRFNGSVEKARNFFETGMLQTCKQIYQYARKDVPVTIYYAYKQSEADKEDGELASTGWETMLSAIIQAGFVITGTWPMKTECGSRSISQGTNALASSIVLVCRKRPTDAPMCTRRDFINTLKRELKPALDKLRASNIAPVDLAQSAIGPGMGVYSRFSKVLEADGTPMSVRAALQIINQELDLYFNEQDSELDRESRFCVELYTQYAFNDVRFGEADVLARAKNTSVDKLRSYGVVHAEKGTVRLLTREELSEKVDKDIGIWLLTQQLTHAMETDGVAGAAKIVADISTSEPERAKDLAYRLFNLAERRGWTDEAFAYNSLVTAWPDVQSKAAELSAAWEYAEQTEITLPPQQATIHLVAQAGSFSITTLPRWDDSEGHNEK